MRIWCYRCAMSSFAVLLSRVMALYLENLASSFLILMPAGAAWLYGGEGALASLLRLAVGGIFLAMFPTTAVAGGRVSVELVRRPGWRIRSSWFRRCISC